MERNYVQPGNYREECEGMIVKDGQNTRLDGIFRKVTAVITVGENGRPVLKTCPKSLANIYCSVLTSKSPATCCVALEAQGATWVGQPLLLTR